LRGKGEGRRKGIEMREEFEYLNSLGVVSLTITFSPIRGHAERSIRDLKREGIPHLFIFYFLSSAFPLFYINSPPPLPQLPLFYILVFPG
jgi:hypothetical protein